MGILELLTSKPESALKKAQEMVPRLRESKLPKHFQHQVIQLVETVIVHQFPKWTRERIAKMLQVTDARQTRVYQEGKEEALEAVALRLLEMGHPVAEIAKATTLTPAHIRRLKKEREEK